MRHLRHTLSPVTTTGPTGAAYLRLSYRVVNGQLIEEDRDGIARQRADMRELAQRQGVDLPDSAIFFEDDTSASKVRDDTSEWARCLAHVREHRPSHLFGTAADRLGRRLADIEGLDDLARETGTRVITLKEGDLFASPAWPFIAAQAKSEALNTAIRVKRAQQSRRASGRDSGGGNRPYGYAADRMTVIQAEAEIIREVARRILFGESTNAIVNDFNIRGIEPVTQGRPWSVIMIRRLAANPRYAGILVYKGDVLGKAAWPAILDEETHAALRVAIESTARPREGRPPTSLLGGLVRCGVCQSTMFGTLSGRNKVPVYRCGGRGGQRGCGRTYRSREVVDQHVSESVLSAVDASVIEPRRQAVHATAHSILQELTEIELDISELKEAYDERRIAAQDYFDDLDRIRKRQTRLQREWGEQAQRLGELSATSQANERWSEWSIAERRAFIRSRIVAVLIHPDGKIGPLRPLEPGEVEIIPRSTSEIPKLPASTDPYLTSRELERMKRDRRP
jgi:site-specific DNA recombinase